MRGKVTVMVISLLSAIFLVSDGYGIWNKDLKIQGEIIVKSPTLEVIDKDTGKENKDLPVPNPKFEENSQGTIGGAIEEVPQETDNGNSLLPAGANDKNQAVPESDGVQSLNGEMEQPAKESQPTGLETDEQPTEK